MDIWNILLNFWIMGFFQVTRPCCKLNYGWLPHIHVTERVRLTLATILLFPGIHCMLLFSFFFFLCIWIPRMIKSYMMPLVDIEEFIFFPTTVFLFFVVFFSFRNLIQFKFINMCSPQSFNKLYFKYIWSQTKWLCLFQRYHLIIGS